MAKKEPLRSSFYSHDKKGVNKIEFTTTDSVPMVDRDFGLLRIPKDRASTPFPRLSTPPDIITLKARLEKEWQAQDSGYKDPGDSQTHFTGPLRKAKLFPMHPEKLAMGTPHPLKGIALNPQLLKKEINSFDWNARSRSNLWTNFRRGSDGQSDLELGRRSGSTPRKSRPTITPRSTRFTKPSMLSSSRKDVSKKGKAKKVTIISPRLSTFAIKTKQLSAERISGKSTGSRNMIVLPSSDSKHLSFDERRKLFYKDEFSIAKNGKKMSDTFIAQPANAMQLDEDMHVAYASATEEIEIYIKKQGLLRNAGTLSGTSRAKSFRSVASFESMKSSHSIDTPAIKIHRSRYSNTSTSPSQ